MNSRTCLFFLLVLCVLIYSNTSSAFTNYVALTGDHIPPFISWQTAATNIQAAVNQALDGNIVLVSNGHYTLSATIFVTNAITVTSIHGPAVTIVDGNNTNQCFFLGLPGTAILNGFTITNGYAYDGGGIRINGTGRVKNCLITGNNAYRSGGVYCYKGGVVEKCTISANTAVAGGGIIIDFTGSLDTCIISKNKAAHNGAGVICAYGGGVVNNSLISENSADGSGGGLMLYYGGVAQNTIISGNSAGVKAGGVWFNDAGSLTNCLVTGLNYAPFGGGVYGNKGNLFNCTISGNYASKYGGGIYCHNSITSVNSIIYYNAALLGGANWYYYYSNSLFSFCCTTPTNNLPGGLQCIPDNPLFENPGLDFHLSAASPCIDSGATMPWMIGAVDLDGNPRIHDGLADMGCYEFVPEPTFLWVLLLMSAAGRRKLNQPD